MPEILNTLYVQTQGTVLRLESDTVRATLKGEPVARVPLARLSGIVVFGNVTVSPFLIHRCAQDGRMLAWFTLSGRFRARLQGPVGGNVLLRRAQHGALDDPGSTLHIARQMVAAKLQNCRQVLLRAAREAEDGEDEQPLRSVAERQASLLESLPRLEDLNQLRGAEGEAARAYFSAFPHMIRSSREAYGMEGRNRRPPRDPINALLSFLYALLRGDCEGALEGVGLDPQVGYLHALRSGRPALALDLMEELRPILADRVALTLVNRQQVKPEDFEATGGVRLSDGARRTVLTAYQQRKEAEIQHRLLKGKIPLGLVPHVQARLLARYIRGDIKTYPPYVAGG
ncbi:MAG: type I-C CRISPR-associated endonuclease Cas1 [Anaerolineales bacterium]|nr:type I-C CRISPR-associated endonuclease Cas1 [Anaerolineales bacterium]